MVDNVCLIINERQFNVLMVFRVSFYGRELSACFLPCQGFLMSIETSLGKTNNPNRFREEESSFWRGRALGMLSTPSCQAH